MSKAEKFKVSSRAWYVWNPDQIVMYLYDCLNNHTNPQFDFPTEGYCLETNGFYRLLDRFCEKNNFAKARITIYTGNMLEKHDAYNIVASPKYWYELGEIQKWLQGKSLNFNTSVNQHFGCFIGRSTWDRLWISSYLFHHYKNQTQQTFHSGYQQNYMTDRSNGLFDPLGLEDLNTYRCPHMDLVIDFLKHCPLTDQQDLADIKSMPTLIKPYVDGIYPIQHPANLNILPRYNNIFVDIICESRIIGNTLLVTEKTWRCILAQRPFIIIGPVNFLSNLKRLGFQTFQDFWPEHYDSAGYQDRLQMIEQVVNYIASLSIKDVNIMLAQMKPVLEHNLSVFKSLSYDTIKKTFQ